MNGNSENRQHDLLDRFINLGRLNNRYEMPGEIGRRLTRGLNLHNQNRVTDFLAT